jgi:O-antigen/teichoic acid export membrane protein
MRETARKLIGRLGTRGGVETTVWVFASYGVGAVAAFALQMVLAGALGLEGYGRLAPALAVAALFETIVIARGADTALGLFAGRAHRGDRAWAGLALELVLVDAVWLGASTAVYLAALAAVGQIMRLDWPLLALLGLATFAQFTWATCKSAQIVFEPVRRQAQLETAAAVTGFVLPAAGLWMGGALGFGWGSVAAGAAKSALAWGFLAPRLRGARLAPPGRRETSFAELRRLGGLALMRSSATFLSGQIDILLLALSGSPAAVGLYRAARTLSNVPARVAAPIWTLARKSVVTGLHHGGLKEARGRIVLIGLGLAALFGPGMALAWLGGDELLALAFGPGFAPAAPALLILLPSSWLFGVVTGWARFAAAVAPRKIVTSLAFVAQGLLCVLLWAAFRPSTAEGMAWVVAAAGVATSAVFWVALFNEKLLLGPKPPAAAAEAEA